MLKELTHATDFPVVDNLNIQTARARGPVLLQDIWLLEKLAHFDREVVPEPRMHAKADRPWRRCRAIGARLQSLGKP